MSEEPKNQLSKWLKRLERESWQLELLISAFTIFLLIQATGSFSEFLTDLQFQYNLGNSLLTFLFIFLSLVGMSLKALTMFLILHLLLRGFWIGTIGLRSVQPTINFEQLNYSEFFTEKLKKKVISLDRLVILLDELCSLMFSFAFLIISILLSFGLYMLFLGAIALIGGGLASLVSGGLQNIIIVISATLSLSLFFTGLIYLIDYFSLGYFKKIKWLSKFYYPIYRFYGFITLSVISKSIYYNLITKFSKRRIRSAYLLITAVFLLNYLLSYTHFQFFPGVNSEYEILTNQYDDLRDPKQNIYGASIQSKIIEDKFIELFIRYDPRDNAQIQSNCPELAPARDEGFNWRFKLATKDMQFFIQPQDYAAEDKTELLNCLSNLYQVSINDSTYSALRFYFYEHPVKHQKGIMTLISTATLPSGENNLAIRKTYLDEADEPVVEEHSDIPFWLE